MTSVELYRGWRRSPRSTRDGSSAAACGSPAAPERMEELRRQAGWAETFGLPLRADLGRGGAGAVPADVDRRRARRRVPADRRLPRSVAAHLRAGRRRARGRRTHLHRHARDRDRRRATGACAACAPIAATSSARSSSTRAGCTRPRSGGWPACASRSSRWRTSTSSRSRSASASRASTLPTLRDPDLLVYFREEGGGLVMGGYERAAAPCVAGGRRAGRGPARLQRPPARGGLGALRGDRRATRAARPGDGGRRDPRLINGRRRSRPTTSSASARPRSAASSWRPASALTGSPAPAGSGKVMADWIADGEPAHGPVGDGRPAVRRALPLAVVHAGARSTRTTRPTTTSATPARSGWPGGRCGSRRRTRWHREHGAAFGEKSGWERVN